MQIAVRATFHYAAWAARRAARGWAWSVRTAITEADRLAFAEALLDVPPAVECLDLDAIGSHSIDCCASGSASPCGACCPAGMNVSVFRSSVPARACCR